MKNYIFLLSIIFSVVSLSSCKKIKDGKVVENSYTGNINVTSGGVYPGGDFTGAGDNGTYSFGWENSYNRA